MRRLLLVALPLLAACGQTAGTPSSTMRVSFPEPSMPASAIVSPAAPIASVPPVSGTASVLPTAVPSIPVVTANGKVFTPSMLTVKKGTTVRFENAGTVDVWPASAPHPEHTGYPEFDPKKALKPGETWSFTFDKAGEWPFHDHVNVTYFGKITVTE